MINESKIRSYAELMDELNLTGLEVREGTSKIRLERHLPPPPAFPASAAFGLSSAGQGSLAADGNDAELDAITSPMVGVFYAAAQPDEDPIIHIGDKISPGDTLCIIEAMKLMNEITSDKAGTVAEICVKSGDVVDFGTPLFKIRK